MPPRSSGGGACRGGPGRTRRHSPARRLRPSGPRARRRARPPPAQRDSQRAARAPAHGAGHAAEAGLWLGQPPESATPAPVTFLARARPPCRLRPAGRPRRTHAIAVGDVPAPYPGPSHGSYKHPPGRPRGRARAGGRRGSRSRRGRRTRPRPRASCQTRQTRTPAGASAA